MPAGTYWADQRVRNGHKEPYGVKVWCLGNEMDGPWQAGHVPAEEYAMRADQAAKLMKGLDNSIEFVACGSSGRFMSTYLTYDRITLEYAWDVVNYVSAHRYSENHRNDTAWFLAEGTEIDRVIEDYSGLFDYVRGMKRANKRVYLSFDEWNVWYKADQADGNWTKAPHLLEETYNLEDALVCAQYLNAFIRHSDVVKIACLAQVVNVIAPLLTKRDGLLVQSNYYPFALMAEHAKGKSLRPILNCPTYLAGERGEVPVLDVSVSLAEDGSLAVFAVNRSQTDTVDLNILLNDALISGVTGADTLTGSDPKAANSWENPHAVEPKTLKVQLKEDGSVTAGLPPLSFTAIKGAIRDR